jgi:hypothetical protein
MSALSSTIELINKKLEKLLKLAKEELLCTKPWRHDDFGKSSLTNELADLQTFHGKTCHITSDFSDCWSILFIGRTIQAYLLIMSTLYMILMPNLFEPLGDKRLKNYFVFCSLLFGAARLYVSCHYCVQPVQEVTGLLIFL